MARGAAPQMTATDLEQTPEDTYYTRRGLACDALLRCKDCQRLVTHAALADAGGCPRCGTKYVTEVKTLSILEWLKIRFGVLDFPFRKEFLAEFSHRRPA